MALFCEKTWDDWINEYEGAHQDSRNRVCHIIGIPLIAISMPMALLSIAFPFLFWPAVGLFTFGWILQFLGHYFEGKPPEFFRDWRFLFVGLRWWLRYIGGALK